MRQSSILNTDYDTDHRAARPWAAAPEDQPGVATNAAGRATPPGPRLGLPALVGAQLGVAAVSAVMSVGDVAAGRRPPALDDEPGDGRPDPGRERAADPTNETPPPASPDDAGAAGEARESTA